MKRPELREWALQSDSINNFEKKLELDKNEESKEESEEEQSEDTTTYWEEIETQMVMKTEESL